MSTINFATLESSKVKSTAREYGVNFLRDALIEAFGESNVTQTGSGEFSVNLGAAANENEVCIAFSVTAKDFENRQTAKRSFIAYDRIAAGEAYQAKVEESAQKKAERAAKKKED